MVASLLYFGHALETTRQSVARSVYFRRRLRGAALLGAAPHPITLRAIVTVAASCSFDSIFLSGNGCGPFVYLAMADNSGQCNGLDTLLSKVVPATDSVSYLWSWDSVTTPNVQGITGGTYSLTVTDTVTGCKDTASYNIPFDSLNMTISGPTTNCNMDYVTYSIAIPDINAYYTWTFKGADTSSATGDSVKIKWTSWPDTLWVIGIDTACGLTDTTILVLDSCCVPSDSATTVYALSDIAATQVAQSSGTGIVYQALPYQPISGGYEVTGATISINGTFTVNENVEFIDCKVYMGPGAVIVVDSGMMFTLDTTMSGDTTEPTVLTACSGIWQGIRLQPTAVFISIDAYILDADSAVYVHGRASITATGSFFEKNYKGIVLYDDTESSAYPLVIFASLFSGDTGGDQAYPLSILGNVGIEVRNVKNCAIGNDTDRYYNVIINMDTGINIINSGAIVLKNYIGINPAVDTLENDPGPPSVIVGVNARDNVNGTAVRIGSDSSYSNFITSLNTRISVNNFSNSEIEVGNNWIAGNDYTDSLDTTGINISINNFQATWDTAAPDSTPYVFIHDNSILNGTGGIVINGISGAARIENNSVNYLGFNSPLQTGIAITDTAPSMFPVGDTIANNQLNNVYHGISDRYRYHPNIIENTITFATPAGSDTCTGISLYLCPQAGLGCNTITGYDASTEASGYGISCDSSTGTLILSNQLNYLGVGIMNFHQQKLQLIENVMETNAVGIGVSDTGATIGNQGNTDTSYDNTWTGTFAVDMVATYNDAEKPTQDIFFVKNAATYNPSTNIGLFGGANPIIVETITPTGEYGTPGSGCIPPPSLQLRMPYFGNNSSPNSPDTSIVQKQLDYKLIPNLFRDNFSASITLGTNENGEVDIYDLNGILIEKYFVGSGINNLNLSNPELTGGVYIYKVFVNGQIKTNDKLVVVH